MSITTVSPHTSTTGNDGDEDTHDTGSLVIGLASSTAVLCAILLAIVAWCVYRKWFRGHSNVIDDHQRGENGHQESFQKSHNGDTKTDLSEVVTKTPPRGNGESRRRVTPVEPSAIEFVSGPYSQPCRQVPAVQLYDYFKRKHADGDKLFNEEFQTIPMVYKDIPATECSREENKEKNRYNVIKVFDHSRVTLSDCPSKSSYINANFLQGYKDNKEFIATQAPMDITVDDFWQMVWEQNSTTINMLCNLQRRGKEMCHKYWPDIPPDDSMDNTTIYGNISVTPVTVTNYADYIIRTFQVKSLSEPLVQPRTVTQFHYTNWTLDDCFIPATGPASILKFRRSICKLRSSGCSGPMVVHCSGGTGETGLYIVIDAMIEKLNEENCVDVPEFITAIRRQRSHMVSTQAEYVYIYKALCEYQMCGNTELDVCQVLSHARKLQLGDPQPVAQGLQQEYEKLEHLPSDDHAIEKGKELIHQHENRYDFIIPFEKNRVVIPQIEGIPDSDYINASWVNSYRKRKAFIITQDPLHYTVPQFWQMIWTHHIPAVVMLTQPGPELMDCYQYWPQEPYVTYTYGPVTVSMQEEMNFSVYYLRRFIVKHTKENEVREVLQYHYYDWPQEGVPKYVGGLINMIGEVDEIVKKEDGGPVAVHCSGGGDRSSVFCAVSMAIETIEDEGTVDVFQTTRTLREQRLYMVPSIMHYEFIYRAILEYLKQYKGIT